MLECAFKGRHPEVDQDEEVGEIAKVEEEIVEPQLLVGVPSVGEEDEGFLGEI